MTCRDTQKRGAGEVVDDEPRDQPRDELRDVLRHPDARRTRGRAARWSDSRFVQHPAETRAADEMPVQLL
jgi:hypothetical protein